MYDLAGKKAFVAGHGGMIGSAIVRRLASEGCHILTAPRNVLDLRDQRAVADWMAANRPDCVFIAAAKVGGILANQNYPADFIYDNLMIEANLAHSAYANGVEKLLLLGSSCIYPKFAASPIGEDALLTGPLEPTNEPYAIAKIAGIKLAQAYRLQYEADFISAMPANCYGPGDNYDPDSSHVLPALLHKARIENEAQTGLFEIWGTGEARREFVHADDCADACVFLMKSYSDFEPVNVGTGSDVTITELARLVCSAAGIYPEFVYDSTKPDGTPRKLLDSTKIRALGWRPRIELEDGVGRVYADLGATGDAFR